MSLRDVGLYAVQAALCSIRIVRKVPDLAENFMSAAAALLKEKHHGVLIAGVQLCTDLCRASSEALGYLRKVFCSKQIVDDDCGRFLQVDGSVKL